jgi:DNA-binding transcriptional ArsR family regulator
MEKPAGAPRLRRSAAASLRRRGGFRASRRIFNRMVDLRPAAPQQAAMTADEAHLDAVFAALADPTRRAILSALLDGDRTVGELASPHAMSLAAISKHLQILARAGLIAQTRAGRTTVCRLLPEGLRGAGLWMQGMGGFDAEDYDALEALLASALDVEPAPD